MIIWSGYGILVPVIVFVNSLIANLVVDYITGDDGFYGRNLIPLGVSFLCSGIVIKLFSRYFSKKRSAGEGTYVFDKVTIAQGARNALFFISFDYWSYILLGLGTLLILIQLFVR